MPKVSVARVNVVKAKTLMIRTLKVNVAATKPRAKASVAVKKPKTKVSAAATKKLQKKVNAVACNIWGYDIV